MAEATPSQRAGCPAHGGRAQIWGDEPRADTPQCRGPPKPPGPDGRSRMPSVMALVLWGGCFGGEKSGGGAGRLLGVWLRPGSLQSCRDLSNKEDEVPLAELGEKGRASDPGSSGELFSRK